MAAPLWVKICANTSLEDAQLAAELGADAVGFVFAPSPRRVTPEQVATITPHLPGSLEKVGVFFGSTPEDLASIAQTALHSGLNTIQLHGRIDLAFATSLQHRLGPTFTIIHTVHWKVDEAQQDTAASVYQQLSQLAQLAAPVRILVDAKVGPNSGGLGIPFDWAQAQQSFASHPGLQLIVAGGLRPENVTEAIQKLSPYGIDVASGVEERPGTKSPEKLLAFMQQARQSG